MATSHIESESYDIKLTSKLHVQLRQYWSMPIRSVP